MDHESQQLLTPTEESASSSSLTYLGTNQNHLPQSTTTPLVLVSPVRSSSKNNIPNNGGTRFYDVTGTMDRLRSSLIGDDLLHHTTTKTSTLTTIITSSSSEDSMCSSTRNDYQSCIPNNNSSSYDDGNDDSYRKIHKSENGHDKIEKRAKKNHHHSLRKMIKKIAYQIPSIILIGMFHLMVGIPFGVSYFPVGWRTTTPSQPPSTYNNTNIAMNTINSTATTSSTSTTSTGDIIDGPFPLPGKEALGIRMFLFATIIGQVSFTMYSGFHNPIGLQMVENVPFCHELSRIAIQHQGYTMDALSTIFVMFGLSSITVGIVFYLLGIYKLGRVVYYFPKHVLVGCIGGIGIFIAKTGIEVTMDDVFILSTILSKLHLLYVVIVFEIVLRLLEKWTKDKVTGMAKYPLLSPIYFCSITPIFYLLLYICNVSITTAKDLGYFFPHIDDDYSSNTYNNTVSMDNESRQQHISFMDEIFNKHLLDIWTVINIPTVSLDAIIASIPTMIALILFSLIHVPINIPAFAISSNADEIDMNQELISHGYSNILSGIFGGLQNYMAYTQSVLYHKSGGMGKMSGMAVACVTIILFFIGPMIASYIPRCMAGCLLLHVGIDLFLEGVYDSYGQFDYLEYGGIWLITVVMTMYGMEASMIAGFITAISTYAVQNTSYVNPIRGSMSATTLRSSHFQRTVPELDILSNPLTGRSRIIVIQLQGHLFFGNVAQFTDDINTIIAEKGPTATNNDNIEPWIVIIDFGLVLGIDSSAAQAIGKIRNNMKKKFHINLCIFVSGSRDGFPTYYNLTKELSELPNDSVEELVSSEMIGLLNPPKVPILNEYTGSHVFASLDEGLVFAENALIAKQDMTALPIETSGLLGLFGEKILSYEEEQEIAISNLVRLAPIGTSRSILDTLLASFTRETYVKGDYIWKQGSDGDCAKILIRGQLIAILEDEAGTSEMISHGNMLGELGLVEGIPRMSSVITISEEAVLYSISRPSYDHLVLHAPHCARIIDLVCVRYLSARVQHVSNRIFETRCLPV